MFTVTHLAVLKNKQSLLIYFIFFLVFKNGRLSQQLYKYKIKKKEGIARSHLSVQI